MKCDPTKAAHTLGLALLSCLMLAHERCSAQFVEVSFQIEVTSSPRDPSKQRIAQRLAHDGRCVFGTNLWMIEGEFLRNAKETWWCTGTNLIQRTVITAEPPERDKKRPPLIAALNSGAPFVAAGDVPHVGDQFTRAYDSAAKRPLFGIAHISWLAFCSGSFLKSEGRRIQLPYPTQINAGDCSDKTQVFNDELGLPERVKVYMREKDLVFSYAVGQSTNYAGWSIPVQFDVTQYDYPGQTPVWRGEARVTSIRRATEPVVPPDVMEHLFRKRDE